MQTFSGKTECRYPLIDSELYKTKPCWDLEPYLDVSYECQPGKCNTVGTGPLDNINAVQVKRPQMTPNDT